MRGRWGSEGRINLIGTLCLEGGDERLEYRVLKGSCDSEEVLGYLDALSELRRLSLAWWFWTTLRFTPPG